MLPLMTVTSLSRHTPMDGKQIPCMDGAIMAPISISIPSGISTTTIRTIVLMIQIPPTFSLATMITIALNTQAVALTSIGIRMVLFTNTKKSTITTL